jgi:dolichyl-phosphate mannosyltransferase polypeptide 3
MKRSTTYALVALLCAVVWGYLKFSSGTLPKIVNWYTDVAPWYSLILFGCYCLAKLGFDLLTFNDYPKEIKKLEQVGSLSHSFDAPVLTQFLYPTVQDIQNAKADLQKRGFK